MTVTRTDNIPDFAPAPRRGAVAAFVSRAAGKSFWALADQGVSSIGNFVTTILVVRSLPTAGQLGIFQLVTEIFLFLNSIQGALIVYPLSVKGAVLDKPAMQRLATACLIFTAAMAIPLAMLMAGATAVYNGVSLLILWTACAIILQQLQETVRRAMLAHLRFREAVLGDSISYVGQALLLYACRNHLTLQAVFAIMAGTSAMALLVQALQVGLRAFPLSELKALWLDFWSISRWMLYSMLGTLVASLSYSQLLWYRWGASPVGQFAVIASLAKIVNPITSAISSLIVPTVSRACAGGGIRFAMRIGLKYAAIGAALLFPYFGVLLVAPRLCIRLIYGEHHADYLDLATPLRILVCSWTLMFITSMTLAILNGLGYSRANFYSTLMNAIVTAVVALPLIYFLGLMGTIAGGLVATGAGTAAAIYLFARHHADAIDAVPPVTAAVASAP